MSRFVVPVVCLVVGLVAGLCLAGTRWVAPASAAPVAGVSLVSSGDPSAAWAVDGNKVYYLQRGSGAILAIAASGVVPGDSVQVRASGNASSAWVVTGRKVYYVQKDATTVLKVQASASL